MRERGLHGEEYGCTPGAFCVDENLVIHFEYVRKPFLRLFEISLHVPYYLLLPTGTFVLMEEHFIRAENVVACSRSRHIAHEPYSIIEVVSRKQRLNGAGPTPRTASDVWASSQHQVYVLVPSKTGLQLMLSFQLIKESISDEALIPHGYL